MNETDKSAIKKVVLAGKKVMYDPKVFETFKQGITKDMPMAEKLATEAVGLMKLLQDRAQGSIPRQVLIPAAALLLVEIAKFMKDSGAGDPTEEDIRAAGERLLQIAPKVFPKQEGIQPPEAQSQPQGQPAQSGILGRT